MSTAIRRLATMRQTYRHAELDESLVSKSPVVQFGKWFGEAVKSKIYEPNAMLLATVGKGRAPALRAVLLKAVQRGRFVFFTNYGSPKAVSIDAIPKVALLFYWPELERQVRIEGVAARVSRAESVAYFRKRPRSSQLGALASPQSQPITSRSVLELVFKDLAKRYRGKPIPCPRNWGGYAVRPLSFEFWQGRPNRLHDRILYTRQAGGRWKISRLAP